MKITLCALTLLALLSGCSQKGDKTKDYSENRQRMEAQAQTMLSNARRELAAGRPDAARSIIQKMRKDCYLAIDGRTQGILLMDSVDLYQSRQNLARTDSLLNAGQATSGQFDEACRKVQFYERKIQYDKQQH